MAVARLVRGLRAAAARDTVCAELYRCVFDALVARINAVLMGLAPDRGLLVPKTIPKVDAPTLENWSKLPFAALATEIISLYIDESEISRSELEQLTKTAYSNWRSDHVTPVHHLDGDYHLLELFHGPTYAFKDVALQFLGVLFELIRSKDPPSFKAISTVVKETRPAEALEVHRHGLGLAAGALGGGLSEDAEDIVEDTAIFENFMVTGQEATP